MAASQLFIVLKDHRQEEPIRLMIMNKMRVLRKAVKESGYDVETVTLKEMCSSVNVIVTPSMDTSCLEILKKDVYCLDMHWVKAL